MRKTPRGWIQIGESRTQGVARIPLGLKPSRDSRTTSQRDSPIWIQPRGVFRYKHHQTHFHYGKYRSLIQVSRIFIPKRPIYNPALDQIMAWRREADKRLSEAVTVLTLTHVCVTCRDEFTRVLSYFVPFHACSMFMSSEDTYRTPVGDLLLISVMSGWAC